MLSRDDLHMYQHRAVAYMVEHDRTFGVLGLGLGKTVSTLTACADLLDGLMVRRILVIAPLRVALHVWPEERLRWSHLSPLRMSVAVGPEKKRRAAVESGAEIVVINRENVEWLVGEYGSRWPFDMLVVDESTSFKSSSARRFKALKKILPKVRRTVLLTATPTPNSLLELWPQVYLLDAGKALGRTFSGFRAAYFDSDYMGYTWTPKPGAKERIEDAIRPYLLTMRTEDYLTLPPKVERDVFVDLPERAAKEYRELKKEYLAEIAGQEITAMNAAVLCGKLHQLAQGAIYHADQVAWTAYQDPALTARKLSGWVETHDDKLEALRDLVESAGEPVVVAYNFRHDLERIKKAIPEAVDVKEPGAVEKWNRGAVPVLCCHPASAGHGLNLQHGGRILIWFAQTWSGELDEQMPGRLYRQGQTKPVMIFRLIVRGTIDEEIRAVLEGKARGQKDLIENMVKGARKCAWCGLTRAKR